MIERIHGLKVCGRTGVGSWEKDTPCSVRTVGVWDEVEDGGGGGNQVMPAARRGPAVRQKRTVRARVGRPEAARSPERDDFDRARVRSGSLLGPDRERQRNLLGLSAVGPAYKPITRLTSGPVAGPPRLPPVTALPSRPAAARVWKPARAADPRSRFRAVASVGCDVDLAGESAPRPRGRQLVGSRIPNRIGVPIALV